MKKMFFVSGVVLMMVMSANAQNIINGNPFYSPIKGQFYNVLTPIETMSVLSEIVKRVKNI